MKYANINISFLNPKTIQCDLIYEGDTINSDIFVSDSEDISLRAFFLWLCATAKSVFYLPTETTTHITINNSENYPETLKPWIEKLHKTIINTQNEVRKYENMKEQCLNYDGKLFLNMGTDPSLYNLYSYAHAEDPSNAYHDTCNGISNNPSTIKSPEISIDPLIQKILKNKIGKIFSHNQYYIFYFLKFYDLYLFSIFELLKVEFIIINFDSYNQTDGHYFHKKLVNNESHRRYCTVPHIEKYWDNILNMENIRYFSFPYFIHKKIPQNLDNYSIVITSWSRIDPILQSLKMILFFLNFVEKKEVFFDYQMLFHTLSYLLLHQTTLSIYEKMVFFKIFSTIYYQTYSFLKLEIIESIKTEKKIYLFGDEGWNHFFPNYYQRALTSDESRDLTTIQLDEPFLFLLMNSNFSYYENNPMMIRILNGGFPYLNISSVIRDSSIMGLAELEYTSTKELNLKINNIKEYIQKEDYQTALNNFSKSNNLCVKEFMNDALHGSMQTKNIFFESIIQQYNDIFLEQIISYLNNNGGRVQECFTKLLNREYLAYDIMSSDYCNRQFMKKIIPLYHNLENKFNEVDFDKLS
ncbi:MAG: hypothetical protein IPJ69_03185 [Deltaproteobacteria bacterium]|nr:MAG: hypothetical protein IPJ69_03185 [Deltaproteobacteria bacterium]